MNASLIGSILFAAAIGSPPPVAVPHAGAPPARATPAVVITFRTNAEVRGTAIRLADVALVESQDASLVARLEGVEVGTAPLFGHSRTVSADFAKIRLRQTGVDLNRLLFRGADLVAVSRPEQLLAGSELVKAAQAAAESANPGATSEVAFVPRDLRLPVGKVGLHPQPVKLIGENSGSVVIKVLVDGQEAASVPMSFRLLRRAPALVATRDLPAGTVLTSDDLRVEERPALPGRLILSDTAQAIGQAASVPIKGGTILAASQLKPAVLIKRGSRIRLICKGPSFIATATGEAMQDGAAGQTIRVRNLSSLRELTGLVRDDQTAEVPF
jgi:flagella basal body P-ring formation protein FlgA